MSNKRAFPFAIYPHESAFIKADTSVGGEAAPQAERTHASLDPPSTFTIKQSLSQGVVPHASNSPESSLRLPNGHGYETLASPLGAFGSLPRTIDTNKDVTFSGVPGSGRSFDNGGVPTRPDIRVGYYRRKDDPSRAVVVKQSPDFSQADRLTPEHLEVEQYPHFAQYVGEPTGRPRPGEAARHEFVADRLSRIFGYASPPSALYDGKTREIIDTDDPSKYAEQLGDHLSIDDPYVREHAPFRVAQHLGEGSVHLLQLINAAQDPNASPALRRRAAAIWKKSASSLVFDALIGNVDKHGNNVMIDGKSNVPWSIDHGSGLGFSALGVRKDKITWGYDHGKLPLLDTLFALVQHHLHKSQRRRANGIYGKSEFSTYFPLMKNDKTLYGNLLKQINHVVRRGKKNAGSIKQLFATLPNGEYHYTVFMNRLDHLQRTLAECKGNPQALKEKFEEFASMSPTVSDEDFSGNGFIDPSKGNSKNNIDYDLKDRMKNDLEEERRVRFHGSQDIPQEIPKVRQEELPRTQVPRESWHNYWAERKKP